MSEYNWKQFTAQSDIKYKLINNLSLPDFEQIHDHNLVANAHRELETYFKISKFLWGDLVGRRALDLCCGAGFVTSAIADFGFSSVGMDINSDAIELATHTHSNCEFMVGDATNPAALLPCQMFDFIIVREAHPFSRIDDHAFQSEIVNRYLSILNPGGLIIIAHARRGGKMSTPNIDFQRLEQALNSLEVQTYGPVFISLINRFSKNPNKVTVPTLSFFASIIGRMLGMRLIEAFFIRKPV